MANEEDLLSSTAFRQAVVAIQKRAEKQTDWEKLDQVFVKSDLYDRVQSPDSQLMLGRRGTGKTHLLRVFQKDASEHGEAVINIDCTRLGSGYPGLSLAPDAIAKKYFLTFLNQLGTDLLDIASRQEMPNRQKQDTVLAKLSLGLVPLMAASDDPGKSTFNYRQISDTLTGVLNDLDVNRLFLALDEWAQIPVKAQPLFAEYLKRSLLTVPAVSLKILAVNYQCEFSSRINGDLVGLERGADIPDVIDLDTYFVYDEQSEFVTSFFGQVLYNHLGVQLKWPMDPVAADKRSWVITKVFTQEKAFNELVRSAEGNPRDFLCIFARAYFDKFRQKAGSSLISVSNVVDAAISWFDSEKASTINAEPEASETLKYLLNNVLKGYKSRTFLVESAKAEHPRLLRLLNERVLHRLNGTYSHQDLPGIRYYLFTVDFGAFARFRNTVNAVTETIFVLGDDSESVVPIDDKRSIRRILFDPDKLATSVDAQLKLQFTD